MVVYWAIGGILAVYLVLVWFLGTLLGLEGSHLWMLRGGLALIGLVAAGVFLWFHHKTTTAESGVNDDSTATGTADIDLLVREAAQRLKNSTLGRGASISSLPVIFLLGEPGSTKTTTIIHSALDPELLAGHVYQDNNILPTRVSNVWYTRQAVFVDPAGDLMTQSSRWRRLIKLVQPGRVSAAFGKGQQAPRAAIVCYNCENFLQSGASGSTVSAARKLAVRLHEVSQLLSISFPVYVLFTKLDRVSFFPEFARDLTKEEASEVLGATLPVRPAASGVYAEEETRRLTKAFDELFYSLAEKRLNLLARETEGDKLPGIYEFPRELRKLRILIVQFLVDLGRPSHLSVNPFLRGFYFSGVRPVIVDDVVQATPQVQATEAGFDGGATRIFTGDGGRSAQAQAPARVAGARKVPQWVFLSQLFNDIIVKDRVALATSGFSTRVSLLRRVALIAVAAVAAICCVGFLVSYLGNRALLSQLKDAQAAEYSVPQANRPPEVSDLLRLEATGRLLNTLAGYNQEDSVPMSLSWGLYVGKDIYPQVCTAYARGLNQLILNPTRISMASSLKQLSYNSAVSTVSGNEAQQAYERAYNLLKTYLIATDQGIHAKGDKDFLSELNENWPARQLASKQQADLVAAQLSRYSAELVGESGSSCVVSPADENAVSNSRSYLNAFPPDQRMYQAMLADATAKIKQDINFDPQYADDAAGDSYRVPAAFTKAGWTAMGHALQTPERYSSGEPWVLGESRQAIAEPQSYVPKLRERYKNEFIQHWLAFLTHARFSGYTGPADISPKIAKVAGARSALLMVLCVTSENTSVDKDIAGAFSGAAGLVSPTECEARVTGPKNAKYTDALFTLSGCLDKMSGDMTPEDKESRRKTCEDQSKTASETVEQLVANNEGTNLSVNKAVQVLLERPIKDPVIARELQPTPAPGAGDLCVALKHFSDDFPKSENSFAELQDIFKPGGLLDKHPVPPTNPNPRYTSFFNEAKRIQTTLYPDGKTLQLHYTIAALPSPGVETFALAVGNQSRVQNINQFNSRKDFTWTGDPHDSFMLRLPGISPAVKEGSLAMFQFVTEVGEPGHLNESGYSFDVEVKQELGRQTTSDQKLKFLIDAGNASVLFQRVSLSNLGCTAKVGQ